MRQKGTGQNGMDICYGQNGTDKMIANFCIDSYSIEFNSY